jgi:hypothetical protein
MTSGGIEGSVAAHVRLRMSAIEQTYLPYNDRCGSCVTRIAGPNGDAQLYER